MGDETVSKPDELYEAVSLYAAGSLRRRAQDKTLEQIGDHMQSEASRIVEWLERKRIKMPYEVFTATLGIKSAVEAWTEARRVS